MNIFNMFRRKPKADLGLTDCIALELVRDRLTTLYRVSVYLLKVRLYTSDCVVFGGKHDYVRTIRIEARPAMPNEPAVNGQYDADTLPRLTALVSFAYRKDAGWELWDVELSARRWGRYNHTEKSVFPQQQELAVRLFAQHARSDAIA